MKTSANHYYKEKLSAQRLTKVYEVTTPRIRQYLQAEISHVLAKIKPGDIVLDLGCGFGRIMPDLAPKAAKVIGIDNSGSSLALAQSKTSHLPNCFLAQANALHLCFKSNSFDVVIAIQNSISAFHVDQKELIKESIRVTRPGGIVLFSSYSAKFWDHRLEWFRMQSEAGLLGEIDSEKTRDGVIICKDGFKATTASPEHFLALTADLNVKTTITEVDESGIFCEIAP